MTDLDGGAVLASVIGAVREVLAVGCDVADRMLDAVLPVPDTDIAEHARRLDEEAENAGEEYVTLAHPDVCPRTVIAGERDWSAMGVAPTDYDRPTSELLNRAAFDLGLMLPSWWGEKTSIGSLIEELRGRADLFSRIEQDDQ